jgi:hypothetical protein
VPVTWEQNGIPDRGSVDQVKEMRKSSAADVINQTCNRGRVQKTVSSTLSSLKGLVPCQVYLE